MSGCLPHTPLTAPNKAFKPDRPSIFEQFYRLLASYLVQFSFLHVFSLLLLFCPSQIQAAQEQVSIQLKWQHSFQFAGYYAAIEQGYYRDVGLDVTLKQIDFPKDNVEQVIAGESEYGVSDSTLVIYHLKGKPVVLLKQFFQHSPLVFLSRRESGIVSPYEMAGKSVVFNKNNQGDASLNTLLFNALGDLSKINKVEYDNTYFQQFIDGKIDVISGYSTSEPYLLKEQGIDVNIINPQNYGIDFYGDNFFTSQKELSEHPARVAKMSQATVKGWQYAVDHPDEIIQLIRDKYNPSLSKDYLQYAAHTTWQMIVPELIELGSVDPKRYQRTGEEYLRLGFTKTSKIKKQFYYGQSVTEFFQVKLTATERAWLKAHPIIRLGSESNWPPFEFTDESGQLQGFSADLIKIIEQRLGIQFKVITQYVWAEMLEKVKNHEIDLLSCIIKTPSREQYLSFTKAYIAPPTAIFTRKDSTDISSLEDLKQKTVAIENQYYIHQVLAEKYPDIKLLTVEVTSDALKALSYGKADAYVGNQAVANWVAEQNMLTNLKASHGSGLGRPGLRLAVRKDWPIFQGILDKAMASISKTEKSAISRNWLGIDSSVKKLRLSASEQKWLNTHKVIRLTGDPNWLPYEAFDKQGNYIGIVAEHLKLIEKKLGIKVDIIPTQSWSESVAKVKRGEIDVLSETSDSDLQSYLTFTKSYVSSPVVIVMKNDNDYVENIEQIKQKKIAVIKEYGYVPEIINKYPTLDIHIVDTIQEGLTAVSTGKVDALLATLTQASYHISELGINNINIVGKTEFTTQLAFGMSKEFAPLIPLFNRALDSINKAEKQRIFDAWGKHEYATKIDYTWLAIIAGILSLIIAAFFFWNRKLVHEVQLRKNLEAQTQALMDAIPLQIFITSCSGEILSANPQALADYKIPKEDIGQYNVLDFYNDRNDRDATLKELTEKGKVEQKIIPFKKPDGTVRSMMLSIMRVNYHKRNALLTIAVDMTERLEIEAAMQESKENAEAANHAKSEFLANMSHEIRTPMNAIIGFTELLNDQVKDPKLKSFVKTIHSAGNSLLLLINDILDLSKIEAGKMDIEKTATNPHELFTELGNIFMMNIREKGLDLIIDVDPEIPESLMLDATRLRQVLLNLIGNAVKFTELGHVRLRARTSSENKIRSKLNLIIDIEDTGIGIPEEQLQTIFNEFQQIEGQSFSKFGGTGLGLPISRRLTELMGGEISVKSKMEQGSTFTVSLNNVDVASIKPSLLPQIDDFAANTVQFSPATILVVDDITDNRQLICANFLDTEITIEEAENGQEAVNISQQRDFDLILMDIRMPVMNGYQAAEKIKQFKDIPIIALTASVMKDDYERAKSENFDSYLRKPVLRADLFATLTRFLDHQIIKLDNSQATKIELSATQQKMLPEVLKKLQQQTEQLQIIQQGNNISDMKRFAGDLVNIAEAYDFEPVLIYANQLMDMIDAFDIEGIKGQLNKFSLLLEGLQTGSKKGP